MRPPSDAPAATTVFLHVGTRKSGTSYLQKTWRRSRRSLADQGLGLLHAERDRAMRELSAPLAAYGQEPSAASRARAHEAAAALVDAVAGSAEPRQLLSLESLAAMPDHVAELVVDVLQAAGHEVHLLLTVRHWGRTIPSEWQQSVKEGLDQTYPDFVAAVRDGSATSFLERHDVAGIVGRWAAPIPRRRWAERVHVVACPPPHAPLRALLELVSEVVGVDAATLDVPERAANASLGLGQAEILRRVNRALAHRPEREPGTQRIVRKWVALGTLSGQPGRPIVIPERHADWVAAAIHRQYEALLGLGVELHGDPRDLLPEAVAAGDTAVSDREVARVAVQAIADLTLRHGAEVVAKDALIARLRAELAQARPTGPPPRARRWRRGGVAAG